MLKNMTRKMRKAILLKSMIISKTFVIKHDDYIDLVLIELILVDGDVSVKNLMAQKDHLAGDSGGENRQIKMNLGELLPQNPLMWKGSPVAVLSFLGPRVVNPQQTVQP